MGISGRSISSSNRRDAILAAALELFRLRGFHAVGIDDIGQAAGITGPGVYRHFPSKDSVLVALFDHIGEQMLSGAQKIGTESTTPEQVLANLVDLHVTIAVAERSPLSVWVQDRRSLPDEAQERIRRRQREYMGEWVRALAGLRPELSEAELETIAFGAVSTINSVAFHDTGLDRGPLGPLLRNMALAVLGVSDCRI